MTTHIDAEQIKLVEEFQRLDKRDLYAVLGLTKDASSADVKKAYRKLALQFHPDKNRAPGADEAFKAVGTAFAILSDDNKRQQYDLYGHSVEGATASNTTSFGRHFTGGSPIDPDEIFRAFFGAASMSSGGDMDPLHAFFHAATAAAASGNTFYYSTGHQVPQHPFQAMFHARERQRFRTPADRQSAQQAQILRQLLPIILFILLSLINNLLNAVFS
jgi:curved DNA-binding protein CbpA